jgi:TonB family protein
MTSLTGLLALLWTVLSFGGLTICTNAQQAQATEPTPYQTLEQQAVHVVISNFAIDSAIPVASTGKPLPVGGSWSVGKDLPATCPKTSTTCLRVFYRVPDAGVSCEWVVLLNGSDGNGVVLEANEDAARYLVKKVRPPDASKLRGGGNNPIYPPMARAAHVTGSVRIAIHVSSIGSVDRMTVIDGPEMLRASAENAVRQWKYEPLMIGSRPVAFQTVVTLNFNMPG